MSINCHNNCSQNCILPPLYSIPYVRNIYNSCQCACNTCNPCTNNTCNPCTNNTCSQCTSICNIGICNTSIPCLINSSQCPNILYVTGSTGVTVPSGGFPIPCPG